MDTYRTMSLTPRTYVKVLEIALANALVGRAIRSATVDYYREHPDYGECYLMYWRVNDPHSESFIDGMVAQVRRATSEGIGHSQELRF